MNRREVEKALEGVVLRNYRYALLPKSIVIEHDESNYPRRLITYEDLRKVETDPQYNCLYIEYMKDNEICRFAWYLKESDV